MVCVWLLARVCACVAPLARHVLVRVPVCVCVCRWEACGLLASLRAAKALFREPRAATVRPRPRGGRGRGREGEKGEGEGGRGAGQRACGWQGRGRAGHHHDGMVWYGGHVPPGHQQQRGAVLPHAV